MPSHGQDMPSTSIKPLVLLTGQVWLECINGVSCSPPAPEWHRKCTSPSSAYIQLCYVVSRMGYGTLVLSPSARKEPCQRGCVLSIGNIMTAEMRLEQNRHLRLPQQPTGALSNGFLRKMSQETTFSSSPRGALAPKVYRASSNNREGEPMQKPL